MREEIDTVKGKMDKLLDMMLAQSRKEEDRQIVVAVGIVIPIQGLLLYHELQFLIP